jgi:hypothetical protein
MCLNDSSELRGETEMVSYGKGGNGFRIENEQQSLMPFSGHCHFLRQIKIDTAF